MTEITCETQGHLWGHDDLCVMCKTPKPPELRTSNQKVDHAANLRDWATFDSVEHVKDDLLAAADEIERLQRENADGNAVFRGIVVANGTIGERNIHLACENERLRAALARAKKQLLRYSSEDPMAAEIDALAGVETTAARCEWEGCTDHAAEYWRFCERHVAANYDRMVREGKIGSSE